MKLIFSPKLVFCLGLLSASSSTFSATTGTSGLISFVATNKTTQPDGDDEGTEPDPRTVKDFHLEIKGVAVGPGPGEQGNIKVIKDGTFTGGNPSQTSPLGANNVKGSGTPNVEIDLDRDILPGGTLELKFEVVYDTIITITKSYWTIKDINTKSVPVPDSDGGQVPIPGYHVNDPAVSPPSPPGTIKFDLRNDLDLPMGIRNLQFLVNSPGLDINTVVPGATPGFGAIEADVVLNPNSILTFILPGSVDPGNFVYAQGAIFDSAFTSQSGLFTIGEQVPESAHGWAVAAFSGVLVASRCRGRRR